MYVAVRRYEGVTDSQKVAQLVEEDYVPIISDMPGFVAYYCVDAGDGVMVSTSVFEHKDAEGAVDLSSGRVHSRGSRSLEPEPTPSHGRRGCGIQGEVDETQRELDV